MSRDNLLKLESPARDVLPQTYLHKIFWEHTLLPVEHPFPPTTFLLDDLGDDVTRVDSEFIVLGGDVFMLHQCTHCNNTVLVNTMTKMDDSTTTMKCCWFISE